VGLLALVVGLLAIATVLWDAFETVVLPRTVTHRVRLTRVYVRATWTLWTRAARRIAADGRRERMLAVYGPLSLLGLLAVWALGLVGGFAALHWSAGSPLRTGDGAAARFADDLYMSGTTFFTLGLGDVHPISTIGRFLTVTESGLGFGFLAIVIAYFPVLYQAFSRREVRLTLLDAWAGSPPAAAEILRRLADARAIGELDAFFAEWEYWCSDILESHISYPVLAYFRSQHQKQSWVAALTTILDVAALVESGVDGVATWHAHATFAIARHAAIDLAQVLDAKPDDAVDRLADDDLDRMLRQLEAAGLQPNRSATAPSRLRELRRSYEPYVAGLALRLMMPLPPWWREIRGRDNWQSSPRRDTTHL
jgi:hypothetical protein